MSDRRAHARLDRGLALLAVVLACAVAAVAWIWNTRAAAGSDAYGYVSEVDLWLRGSLKIDQSFARTVPWPLGDWSFTPLGYRPTADGRYIVPTYPAGLPLMMAAAKALAGNCFMFTVVPASAAVLIGATFAIGRRLQRPVVGLAAAWLVATSPVVLFMSMAPMSDVPAAAAWTLAVALLLGETRGSAALAGGAAAVAILIRPNLVPLLAVMVAWIAWRDIASGRWRDWRRACTPWVVAGGGVGILAVAAINSNLYGSPFRSGYGDLSAKFSLAFLSRNLRQYGQWLVSTETVLAAAGLLALVVPVAPVWPTAAARRGAALLGGCAAVVWASYLAYQPFDAWWYLRFLLPTWPMMAIGAASLLGVCGARRGLWPALVAGALLVAVGVHGLTTAVRRDVFVLNRGEARYMEAARAVEAVSQPDDVIVAGQHSGTVRYYAGRLTLRYDYVDPAWLDRAIEWLEQRGHHVYFVLDDREVWALKRNWAPASRRARLDWTPLVLLRGGTMRIYDATPHAVTTEPPRLAERSPGRCMPPRPLPTLRRP